jgi:hypothetical protein
LDGRLGASDLDTVVKREISPLLGIQFLRFPAIKLYYTRFEVFMAVHIPEDDILYNY